MTNVIWKMPPFLFRDQSARSADLLSAMRANRLPILLFLNLFYKSCAEDAHRQREHPDSEYGDQHRQYSAQRRDRKDVAITDRRERHDRPPYCRGYVGEFVRLSFIFCEIHE